MRKPTEPSEHKMGPESDSDADYVFAPRLPVEERIAYYETYRRMGGVAVEEYEILKEEAAESTT
jgi:hypothetical protein